ncbi:Cytidine deaminase [Aphelenchoides bicaudatus]|nr:Cytidine deaminase [Aphelenchoides bicaudatus]
MIQEADVNQLVQKAISVFQNAYNVYSRFPVSAAIYTESGEIFVGVNVENASFGGTICAERSAVVSAVSQGHRKFKGIVVVTQMPGGGAPCGLCRQFMIEFGNFPVFFATPDGEVHVKTTTYDLLPYAFTPSSLEEHKQILGESDSNKLP